MAAPEPTDGVELRDPESETRRLAASILAASDSSWLDPAVVKANKFFCTVPDEFTTKNHFSIIATTQKFPHFAILKISIGIS
jgi:hypothetical protein